MNTHTHTHTHTHKHTCLQACTHVLVVTAAQGPLLYFFFVMYLFNFMCVGFVYVYVSAPCVCSTHGVHQRSSDHLKPELQAIVSFLSCLVLDPELQPSAIAEYALE